MKCPTSMNVTAQQSGAAWHIYNGDCCEVLKGIPSGSIGFTIFSPPFASLYTYSNSERDLGNCRSDDMFMEHFRFVVSELYRVTKPGRLVSFHCMNLPSSKERDGVIGLKDFRGDLVWMFRRAGWIFHSEVCIWKDPVIAMQRTKALGLLHKQIVKDSCMSRQGIPDYLVTMRKPGVNPDRVDGEFDKFVGDLTPEEFELALKQKYHTRSSHPAAQDSRSMGFETFLSVNIWQKYASPIWMDIDPGRTLQRDSARDQKDERHICPLQLDVIERAMILWSKPGDVVLSPFAGIGSEGYIAVKEGRKFIGIELKESYYNQACLNMKAAEDKQYDMLSLVESKP